MKLVSYEGLRAGWGIPHSRVTIWRLERQGRFPRHLKAGNRNCWLATELEDYISGLAAERDAAQTDVAR